MSEPTFEDQLQRLEEIVGVLEAGTLPLDESLRIFEEGVTLARGCAHYLDTAERRIEILVKDPSGALVATPFPWDDKEKDGKA